jgi:hypothetical protein
VIPLSRAYPCKLGAPVLDRFDEAIFTLRYFAACLDCGFCADQCCSYGVDIDNANMTALRGLGPAFETFVGVPAQDWFTGTVTRDSEFPSGAYGRTAAPHGKCVFAERNGRGCRIHAWCLQNGLDYHAYKPLVSTLFPLTFEHGALVPSPEAVDGSLICGGSGPSLYDGARSELAWYFGEELVAELDASMRCRS